MKFDRSTFSTALLGGAGTAALATLIATGARAGETRLSPETPPLVTGSADAHAVVNVAPLNVGDVLASITDATTSSLGGGTDSAVSATVESNAMRASATGNDFANVIDLSVVPSADALGTGDGAASLAVSTNVGAISSFVAGNGIGADHTDFEFGTLGVTDNVISATSTGNRGSTLLQGDILPAYSSETAGSSTVRFNAPLASDWFVATGGLVATTLQMQAGTISNTAIASQNAIQLSILNTEDDTTIVASPTLEDNAIAASVTGNSSGSAIEILPGGAATLAGTAVLTNGQLNYSLGSSTDIAAVNASSRIIARIAADDDITDDAELRGSLSVAGNAITASASGNRALGEAPGQAGNRILLADGASFAGSPDTSDHGAGTAYTSGVLLSDVNADLVINNSQANLSASNLDRLLISASAQDSLISANVDNLAGGTVSVANNEISGTATGNAASSALAGGHDMASFQGSAAVANQQVNFFSNVSAEAMGIIGAGVSDDSNELSGSTVSVDRNKVAATAYGNSVSQSLALDAVTQNLPLSGVALAGGTGGTYGDGNVQAGGNLTVTNLQANYSSDVDADEFHEISAEIYGYGATDSTIGVTRNTAEAVAIGTSAANALALSGTAVGRGAGIVSVQINDHADGDDFDDTEVAASSTGSVNQLVNGSVEDTTLEVSGNLQRAIAYGGSAANTLSVNAETITVDSSVDDVASAVTYDYHANDGLALTYEQQPEVRAAYGVLNVQSLNGDVAASANGAGELGIVTSFAVNVESTVYESTVINSGNALVAAAYGADAANAASLDVGTLDTSDEDFAPVMNVTNVQEATFGSTVTAQASGQAVAATGLFNEVLNSTVATSSNTVQALAYANRAGNSITASGNSIDTEADFFPIRGEAALDWEGSRTDASFSVNNAQVAGGRVTATLLDDVDPDDAGSSAAIFTTVGDYLLGSSVTSNGNTLSSGATANRADNLVDLGGNGLATTSAIANFQRVSEEAEISSFIGTPGGIEEVMIDPGTPDTDPEPFEFEITGTGLGHEGGAFTAGTLYVDAADLSTAQREALEAAGWELAGEDTYSRSAAGFEATISEYGMMESGSITRTESTSFIPGTPPTYDYVYVYGTGGVSIAVDGALLQSTVAIDGNTVAGSATGNSAGNALKVSGNGIEDGSDHLLSYGTVDGADTEANADHMVANLQIVDAYDSELTSYVYNTFAIDVTDGAPIEASALSVDGNSQSSRAVANTADNSIELEAGNTAAGTALVSNQYSGADVLAVSGMDIYAPVASNGSQVSLSDNTNVALAVVNNVTNTLTVSGNTVNPTTFPISAIVDVDDDAVAYADHVLVNSQYAEDSVIAEAETLISNQALFGPAVGTISDGSVTISGNSTMAEATANRATNLASVSAGSGLDAAAGVTNSQVSETLVQASATSVVGVTLAAGSGGPAALNAGSVTVGGNATTALARGNAATNALNYAAGAVYPGSGDSAYSWLTQDGGDLRASAQAAVLNAQANHGPVMATATGVTYGVALNGGGNPEAVTSGTVRVLGNVASAVAYGNTATNSVTLTSLNSGQPTAVVGNAQFNSGSVIAAVSSVTYGAMTGGGAVLGSSTAVTGNQVSATAVGNSAVSTIAAR